MSISKPTKRYPRGLGKVYNFHESMHYLEKKYKFDMYSYKGHDFWHWVVDSGIVHNGCFYQLGLNSWLEDEDTEDWLKDILGWIKKEFAPRSYEVAFWVEW